VPVSAPVTAVGRVYPGERPAIKVVRTVYHGPYEGLGSAWGEFSGWLCIQIGIPGAVVKAPQSAAAGW
jgi:hypothetical protein